MEHIANDPFDLILKELPAEDLPKAARVSRRWNEAVKRVKESILREVTEGFAGMLPQEIRAPIRVISGSSIQAQIKVSFDRSALFTIERKDDSEIWITASGKAQSGSQMWVWSEMLGKGQASPFSGITQFSGKEEIKQYLSETRPTTPENRMAAWTKALAGESLDGAYFIRKYQDDLNSQSPSLIKRLFQIF